MIVFAIDPGCEFSGWVIWNGFAILGCGKDLNTQLSHRLYRYNEKMHDNTLLVIEQVRSYGMAVGASVFDTVFWSGRFWEAWDGDKILIPRLEVKKHICHNGAAKDSNIIQALVDRFAYGEKNKGKGTKKNPGFFYGFKKDIWQAFALSVTCYDQYCDKNSALTAKSDSFATKLAT